jgi:hypothetical protein
MREVAGEAEAAGGMAAGEAEAAGGMAAGKVKVGGRSDIEEKIICI